jgi:hypothetical protein
VITRAALFACVLLTSTIGIAEAAPTWCAHPQIYKVIGTESEALTETNVEKAIINLVDASCERNVKPEDEKVLAAARARWNKVLDLTDADWGTDVVPWSIDGGRTDPKFNNKDAPTTESAIGQFARMRRESYYAHYSDAYYALDHYGDKLTMSGRLGALDRCLYSSKPAVWALCQADTAAFDKKKVFAEMRADKSERGYDRMVLRIAAENAGAKIAARAQEIKALVAKDEGYKKLFEIEAEAHKDWAANPPDAALLALASQMDDAGVTKSNKALAGCEETTWKAFSSAVAAIPAAKFKDIKRTELLLGIGGVLVNDKNAYLASAALVVCRTGKRDQIDQQLAESMRRWPGYRGPRSAALTQMMKNPIQLDDRTARIELPELNRFDGKVDWSGGGKGAVAKVKANGDTTLIEFVKKPVKVSVCEKYKATNQVEQVTITGAVIYGYTCLKYGTETLMEGSEPQTVKTMYASGIKPGVNIQTVGPVVIAVYPKSGDAPTHVLGIAVK